MTRREFIDLYRTSRSPWEFLRKHVKTRHPTRGALEFPSYLYLHKLVHAACCKRFLLVPKSRQMMVTWTMVGLFLWRALFRGPGIYLFLSRNERCAEELIDRARFILDRLPSCMRPKLSVNSRQEIAFGSLGSRIFSIPATPDGPRMHSPTGVFWDEMAFTPYDRQIWSALQPALMSGGRFVGVSSSGGALNFFADTVKAQSDRELQPLDSGTDVQTTSPANSGRNPGGREEGSLFQVHRIHYSMHPERGSEEWKQIAGAGLSQAQWDREQEISFEAADDLVYSEFDPVRHILPDDWIVRPEWEIYRSIDFGYRHPFVLWLQQTPSDEFIIFDEWTGTNVTTERMIEDIRRTELAHGISGGDVSWSACDPAGASMQDTGISPVDALNRHGFRLRYRSSRILPGIEQVKAALMDVRGRTTLRISPRCRKLIADLGRYRWAPGREEPLKDGQCDHSMDALRYFFVNRNSGEDAFAVQPRLAGRAVQGQVRCT